MTAVLDRKSKIFLDFLDKQPNKSILYHEGPAYPAELGTQDDFFALIRYLEENGYVEFISSKHSGAHLGVLLSYKGRHRREFAFQDFLHYAAEKWIDLFALVVAIIALGISIIALTQG